MPNLSNQIGSILASEAQPLERVLNLLLDSANATGNPALIDESILLKNRYNELEVEERRLLVSNRPERTMIAHAVLKIARDLDEIEPAPALSSSRPKTMTAVRTKSVGVRDNEDDVVLRLNRVTKQLATQDSAFVLQEVSFAVTVGELLAIIGPNGSGKTTVMRMLAGEISPDSGSLTFPALSRNPWDWIKIKRRIAYVDQFPLKWERPLLEVLRYNAAVAGFLGDENERRVQWALARLGLAAHASKGWTQLSGGYRTRFALARCLISKAPLILLDEPLAHLDVAAQASFLRDLRTLSQTTPFSAVLTSQHIYEAEAVSDQILILDGGRMVYAGPVDDLADSATSTMEFSTSSTEEQVAAALPGVALTSPMLNRYVATLSRTSCSEFIAKLDAAGVDVTYLRDLSRSSRRFLREPL